MNQVMTLLRQLEAHVQEEIGAQSRVLAALEAQGEALRSHESARIVAATSTLDAEIMAQARRTERRNELLSALAAAWSLPTGTLTLGSIVQRVGDEGRRLARQREELAATVGNVARQSRRNGLVARLHQRVTSEVLQAVLVESGDNAVLAEGGALVDAEG
jgi:hypothetical protein